MVASKEPHAVPSGAITSIFCAQSAPGAPIGSIA